MPHELTIGTRSGPANFEITVDGEITTPVENPTEDAIIESGSTVEGLVDETDLQFQFSGDVTDITVTEHETIVSIDGEPVDPADFWT